MVEAGPQDDHRLAFGLFGVGRKFAGYSDDLFGGHACNSLRPGRRVGLIIRIIFADMITAQSAIQTVIGAEQVEHRGDKCFAVLGINLTYRHTALQNIRMVGSFEMVMFTIAEVGEGDIDHIVAVCVQNGGHAQLYICALSVLLLQIPLAFLTPAETSRA